MTEAQENVLYGICTGYNNISMYQLRVAVKLVELGMATIEKQPDKGEVQLLPTKLGWMEDVQRLLKIRDEEAA